MTLVQTCLWFDGHIDEAAAFYVSLVPGSRIIRRDTYPESEGLPEGTPSPGDPLTVELEIGGVPYILLNGGPLFPLSEAVSISLTVPDQAEVDRLWEAIVGGGGEESQCGWCRDRFGLSWQIVPERLLELLHGPHAQAVNQEMLGQRKLDVARLEAAADAAATA